MNERVETGATVWILAPHLHEPEGTAPSDE